MSDQTAWLAIAWLATLVLFAALYGMRILLRSDYDWWESCLYLPTYLLGRLLWRVKFTNQPPVELRSGAILAANHRNSVDPFFVQLAARRRVHWMVAKEFCQHFAFGPILRALEVIPTNRSGMDTASTKAAMRLTASGKLVGMFPEGKLNFTRATLLPLRAGAALVALRSEVPLIPLLIEGGPNSRTVWRPILTPARVRITFGQPILPASCIPHGNSGSVEDQDSRPREQRTPVGNQDDLSPADELILQWGKQILALAGKPTVSAELASKRKQRKRR